MSDPGALLAAVVGLLPLWFGVFSMASVASELKRFNDREDRKGKEAKYGPDPSK